MSVAKIYEDRIYIKQKQAHMKGMKDADCMSPSEEERLTASGSGCDSPSNCSSSSGSSSSMHSGSTISNINSPNTNMSQIKTIRNSSTSGGKEQRQTSGHVRLIPRQPFQLSSPALFTYKKLTTRFHMLLPEAAKSLGISESSLKKVCRKLGVARWPRWQNRHGSSFDDTSPAAEKRKRSTDAQPGQSTRSKYSPMQTSSLLLPCLPHDMQVRKCDASSFSHKYLDLKALEEHTAFPPLSALLAQGIMNDCES